MRIRVERKWPKDDYIMGRFFIDGKLLCNSLEPPWRNNARYTAIPRGVYEVEMTYSAKFRRVLPLLCDVPRRSGVRIHKGNLPSHTQGCILVGENTQKGKVLNSTVWEQQICRMLQDAQDRGEIIQIEIV